MNYLGKFIDNFRHVYKEINAATLTGAIDVIVVEQPDGSYTCSPFHVRFGKIGVLRSREKIVEIEINGEPCDIYMKLGESGEAFFVEELSDEDRSVPQHLVCSPIPYSESQDLIETESAVWTAVSNLKGSQELPTEILDDAPISTLKTFHAKTVQSLSDCEIPTSSDFRPIQSLSEHEGYQSSSEVDKLATLNKSETNVAVNNNNNKPSNNKKKRRRKKKTLSNEFKKESTDKIEDEDEDKEKTSDENPTASTHDSSEINEFNKSNLLKQDDEIANLPQTQTSPPLNTDLHFFSDTDVTCSNEPKHFSPVQSDTEFEVSRLKDCDECAISSVDDANKQLAHRPSWRWGELPSPIPKSELQDLTGKKEPTQERDHESKDGCDDKDEDVESGNGPSLAQSPVSEVEASMGPDHDDDEDRSDEMCKDNWDLAMSLCGGQGNVDSVPTFEQFNEHLISYEQFINDPAIFKNPNLMFRINGNIYKWDAACPQLISYALFKQALPKEVLDRFEKERVPKSGNVSSGDNSRHRRGYYSWFYWSRATQNKPGEPSQNDKKLEMESMDPKLPPQTSSDTFDDVTPNTPTNEPDFLSAQENNDIKRLRTYSSTDSELENTDNSIPIKDKPEKYRKTLRLTSEQIASLNLQPGANEIMFSVTTAYQGTTRCKCTLFLWRYDDQIVISDIDGTITKSDVLGHIMPIVGNAWAQSGVAKLFNRIEDNGYKLLYLSARAIGQSKGTRRYLNSIKQEDLTLPEGPILLNPTSLLSAFHREVIEKKPEEFKISCLRDIQALFPPNSNPFYAGYGNKINDVWTYQAVGIPMFRIFTINHRGELRHELTKTFQSSYLSMSQIADQLFPVRSRQTLAEEFSEFNYWRDPIPSIEELLPTA
ncbi:phosphatidate phosphatase LPIN3 isoform X2 [Planococcus citri]|uniref:phosphatidate phosphatase LPIN3 isoform X2 n=1 Tax=Planococcus citri TaxID=170843 RepID=UPI0031FA307E